MGMLQAGKTSEFSYEDARLWVCVRFCATWLLGGTLLAVSLGPSTGIPLGLLIAIGYVRAVHWNVVLEVLAPRSRKHRDSRVLGPRPLMTEAYSRRVFIASSAVLFGLGAFAYGFAVEFRQLWPHDLTHSAYSAARSLILYGEIIPEGRRLRAPSNAAREVFKIYDPSAMNEGHYVFLGWDDLRRAYAAWLYDRTGRLLHTWSWDYLSLDPDGPLNGVDSPHAFHVLADGSIVVGFDRGDVVARLDVCSKPVWIKHAIYHHSFERADDGTLWTWKGEGTPYGHYDRMVNFDPETGEELREIRLVDDVIKSMGPAAVIFGVRPDYRFQHFATNPANKEAADIFHGNDVEPLRAEMKPAFPMFETGDLLISLRNINLVAVVDPDDYRVKWWSTGPWIGQHDPDFVSDGKISVYNNNTRRGRSEIVKIDPATREISNELFAGGTRFYSGFMGRHQYLPNGNVLIAVPDEGRVIEVSSHGRRVMEFNNVARGSADYNEIVADALWIPADYFAAVPNCRNRKDST
jgi:hypothetical protein